MTTALGRGSESADGERTPAGGRDVLIAAQRPSDFAEMRRAAEALAARGHCITFLFHAQVGGGDESRGVLAELERMRDAGVCRGVEIEGSGAPEARPTGGAGTAEAAGAGPAAASSRGAVSAAGALKGRARALLMRVPRLRRLLNSSVGAVLAAIVQVREYRRKLHRYRELVGRLRPDIIVLPEDVVGPFTPLLIRAGHDLGVPSLILPYTIANQDEAFTSLEEHPAHQLAGPNWLIGRLFPKWVLRREGRALLRLPAPHVLGHLATGTSPPDPWMMNSGFANRVAVENSVMKAYYVRAGLPESKLEVVGTVSDDQLARLAGRKPEELARLGAELRYEIEAPLLVVGGCPNQLAGAPGFAFSGYEEMVAHMAGCMKNLSDRYTVLLRPHPNFAGLVPLFEAHGIRSCTLDTARLVALADAYIAFASATIRWAVALGIPTINYDVFHYGYDDYRTLRGVLHAVEPTDFAAAVERLHPEHPEYAELRQACRDEAPSWGALDGCCTERIEALVNRLCAEKPVRRSSR